MDRFAALNAGSARRGADIDAPPVGLAAMLEAAHGRRQVREATI
jgi:hypothetical protein